MPWAGRWQGTVGIAEHLGSDTFLRVHDTGLSESITVRAPGEVGFRHKDRIYLDLPKDRLHRFDKQGQRL